MGSPRSTDEIAEGVSALFNLITFLPFIILGLVVALSLSFIVILGLVIWLIFG